MLKEHIFFLAQVCVEGVCAKLACSLSKHTKGRVHMVFFQILLKSAAENISKWADAIDFCTVWNMYVKRSEVKGLSALLRVFLL